MSGYAQRATFEVSRMARLRRFGSRSLDSLAALYSSKTGFVGALMLLSVVVAALSIPLPMFFFNINLKLAKSLRNERV